MEWGLAVAVGSNILDLVNRCPVPVLPWPLPFAQAQIYDGVGGDEEGDGDGDRNDGDDDGHGIFEINDRAQVYTIITANCSYGSQWTRFCA